MKHMGERTMIVANKIMPDPAEAFRSALLEAGLQPNEVAPDGQLLRCPTTEKPHSKNGWHVLYADPPAGAFGDWATGLSETWSFGGETLTGADYNRIRKEIEKQRIEREADIAKQHRQKAEEAQHYLSRLKPAEESNPYLSRKQVKPCAGLLSDGDNLIVPVLNSEDNRPMSFQRIKPGGDKRFMSGGQAAGGYFAVKGKDGASLIAEGIATALSLHEATGLTVLVSFSAGNLEAVAHMVRDRYPDRRVIICADDDAETAKKTGKNTGTNAADKATIAVNGMMAVPGRPGDFNDLHQAEGPEAVKTAVGAAVPPKPDVNQIYQENNWPEPMSLTAGDEKAEPYPVDALPGAIGEAVTEVTGFVLCPVALTACSAMAAISTVTAGLVDVQRADKLIGPTALYIAAIADSGERKSTVDSFFTRVIQEWEAEQEGLAEPDLRAYRTDCEAWEAKKAGAVNAIREASKKSGCTDELERHLADLEERKPEKPKVPRLLIGDATSEALIYRLAHYWPVGGMLSSEAGIVFGGHAMGRDSIMRNLATLNTLWDGLPLRVDRRTTESYSMRSARLTLGLAVQPETVRQFIDGTRGLARGSGFLARFLIAWPESTQGQRMFREAPERWPALERFHRRLGDLLDLPVRLDDFGQLVLETLGLSQDAKSVWIKFHNEVEAELLPNGDMEDTRDVASKAGDNAARMAALFHVFEHGPTGTIGPEHIQAAARVVTWHLFEARRFLKQLATPIEVSDAIQLEGWLLERCRQDRVSEIPVNHVQKFGPNKIRRKKDLDAALYELETAGRLRCTTDVRKKIVRINPEILRG